jgi:hypothetical protein
MKAREVIVGVFSWYAGAGTGQPDRATENLLSKLSEAGFVIVPKEPTEGMILSGTAFLPNYLDGVTDVDETRKVYVAMISTLEEE